MTFDEIKKIVSLCKYRDWEFRVLEKGDGFLVQLRFMAKDSASDDPTPKLQSCRKWYVSSHSSKGEVVRTCWKAVEAAVMHEAQEDFTYRGKSIMNPHLDPDALIDGGEQKLSVRKEPPAPSNWYVGKVRWFNDMKGFGFVDLADTPGALHKGQVFVHHTAIVTDGFRTLSEGQIVNLKVLVGAKGLQATEVTPLTDP